MEEQLLYNLAIDCDIANSWLSLGSDQDILPKNGEQQFGAICLD